MRLLRYRVTNFRSVQDSGWIELERVMALIGVNESGKTNLLVPLWKLNPAREGSIQPTADYPKREFGAIREKPGDYAFVSAEFDAPELAQELSTITGHPKAVLQTIRVTRYYDGEYDVDFPDCKLNTTVAAADVAAYVDSARAELEAATALAKEEVLKPALVSALTATGDTYKAGNLKHAHLTHLASLLKKSVPESSSRTSTIVPIFNRAIERLEEWAKELNQPSPAEIDGVTAKVLEGLPTFVYYSNYGNLDSEIYLPHVVANLKREDLGPKEADKARTLRVLFKFVRLSPAEILELGRDFKNPERQPSAAEIAAIADKKRERSILLQSASATLTTKFKQWWKQGDYRFRFEADGDHFRIWVSDDRRPEEVELESRSTGLQWFLSFYLVFLVESEGEHANSVLLLDEPGLSLHPLAQKSLSEFFEGLSATNQIIFTTHSPFLVDADRLDRARKVYVSADGSSKITEDLRQGAEAEGQAGAAYAVHSALNLNVAESLLVGCEPVIVEGPSDQHYLTAIKALLIGAGKITPKRELVFPPAGGTKTARITASILSGRDEVLPRVLLDGDAMGLRMAAELKSGLYVDAKDRVLTVDQFTKVAGSEIEDLFPADFIARVVDRWQRAPDVPFQDVVKAGEPLVPQIEAWAAKHGVVLEAGWKVKLAQRVKQFALDRGTGEIDAGTVDRWTKLFEAFG